MSLTRMIVLFVAALAIMLAVVALRAETTRVHYLISELDRQEDALRQEQRHEALALERARNPAALLERIKQMRLAEPRAEPVARPGQPVPPPKPKPAPPKPGRAGRQG